MPRRKSLVTVIPRARAGRGEEGDGGYVRRLRPEEACQERPPAAPARAQTAAGLKEQAPQRAVVDSAAQYASKLRDARRAQ